MIKDWLGFQQHPLNFPMESAKWGIQPVQSFRGPTLCHLESTMSTAYVVCGLRDRIDRMGHLDNDHETAHVLLWLYNVNYLVVCYILLLVTDKLEMPTCLADKMWMFELERCKSKDRRLDMTSWKPSHPSFEVALINWFGRWCIHLQARILLEDCSQ